MPFNLLHLQNTLSYVGKILPDTKFQSSASPNTKGAQSASFTLTRSSHTASHLIFTAPQAAALGCVSCYPQGHSDLRGAACVMLGAGT